LSAQAQRGSKVLMDFHRIAAFDKESLIKQEEGIPYEWAFGDGTGLANELADDPQPTKVILLMLDIFFPSLWA
jgi:hypothetical protein